MEVILDHPGGPQIQSQVSFIKWRQRAIDHRRGESSVRIEVDVGGVCGGRGGVARQAMLQLQKVGRSKG